MTSRQPLPLKSMGLYFLLLLWGLFSACVTFLGAISIWVGLRHAQQEGFWMPILVGALCIIATLLLFARLAKFVRNQMKERDLIEVQG